MGTESDEGDSDNLLTQSMTRFFLCLRSTGRRRNPVPSLDAYTQPAIWSATGKWRLLEGLQSIETRRLIRQIGITGWLLTLGRMASECKKFNWMQFDSVLTL